ncbi:M14 family metallopeptidase [Rufibacter sediminis]|uniref:Peptidase M14 n=1 Tax=Rufibacter sediminis TaxID=2762756 RepID=A0ABR6VS69_9BACT|nr:M14 family metallopeptidase [Rufibacter sediminis]MBC3539708.1 peptidase M14 [Rufibacter sediminis]
MKNTLKAALLGIAFTGISSYAVAQRDYQSYEQMTQRLQKLSSRYSKLVSLTTVGKTATGKEIWMLTMGRDNSANKPAIVVAAGVEGTQLATTELAVQMAEQMLQAAVLQDSVRELLQSKTFYIFPNLTPDASEQYHEKLRWERTGNAQPVDDDRDGRMFEDPFEDLNKDGLITMMRIKSPTGTFRPADADPRIMVKADAAKGEKGEYLLYTEGIDNDKDGKWNEDPEGGVQFNRNFTFDYPYFQEGAGEHPMSERETKAFADFLYDAKNVYAVFLFGPANTLSEPLRYDKAKASARIMTGLLEKDAAVNEQISKLYNTATRLRNAPRVAPSSGDVLQWAYFHYGRFSYSTPGWWTPKMEPTQDTTGGKSPLAASEHADVNFLRWAEANDVVGTFVNWQSIKHPDFPDQVVEIGGLAPYVKQTPPVRLLGPIAQKHFQFFSAYAKWMPSLQIVNIKSEKVDGGLTRITADVYNQGSLPTHAEIGDKSRWVQKVKVSLQLSDTQKIVSGNKIQLSNALAGGEKFQVSWLVNGKGYVSINAQSPMAGKQSKEVFLR